MDEKKALHLLEENLITLNSTVTGRRAFLTALPILMTGCATMTADRNREGDNTGQYTSMTVADEQRMTQEVLPKMRKDYPAHRSSYAQSYIENLGQKIVQANNLNGNPYRYNFTVVDVKNVNAFALPAGTVFVTAPLIKMADSEAELAGVIGHEVGHIQARHTAERMEVAKREQKKSWMYGLGGAILGGAAGFGLGKLLCSKQDRECLKRAMMYGGMAGVGGGLLIQKYGFMANSREDEMEADRIGFKTSLKAGYHKDHIGLFYSKLLTMEQQYKKNQNSLLAPLADAMSTHPPSQQRVNQMNAMASSTSAGGTKVTSRSFEKLKKLL